MSYNASFTNSSKTLTLPSAVMTWCWTKVTDGALLLSTLSPWSHITQYHLFAARLRRERLRLLFFKVDSKPWPQIQGEKVAVGGIRYKGVFGTISTMIRTEGPRSLYNGLVAGLQRQMCFASVRIGLYDNVKNFYTGGKESKRLL